MKVSVHPACKHPLLYAYDKFCFYISSKIRKSIVYSLWYHIKLKCLSLPSLVTFSTSFLSDINFSEFLFSMLCIQTSYNRWMFIHKTMMMMMMVENIFYFFQKKKYQTSHHESGIVNLFWWRQTLHFYGVYCLNIYFWNKKSSWMTELGAIYAN